MLFTAVTRPGAAGARAESDGMAASPQSHGNGRLVELDALRGIAASLVMLFHYTTQYDRLYGHETAPLLTLPWGHYGVNLFFMISGFVIFLTLHRIQRPLDFLVSRFSRLFPAFWAAVAITFLAMTLLPLPGKSVGPAAAVLNLFMIHGLVRIPHVDSVYWTLEVELIFYAWALLLYRLGRLDRVHAVLATALMLRLVYFAADRYAGVRLSTMLGHLMILSYIPWFICGIMIYRRTAMTAVSPRADRLVLAAAIAVLAMVEGVGIGLLAAALSLTLWLAATERLPWLANPVLAWLGAISYTLYLLHENIGWTVILRLERAGADTNLAILAAVGLTLLLATTLTYLLERPAMVWLRRRYRQQTKPAKPTAALPVGLAVGLFAFAGLAYAWHASHPKQPARDPAAAIYHPAATEAVPCHGAALQPSLRILVLGQSNAGNHGEATAPATASGGDFYFEGHCFHSNGPVPGATGQGGAIWPLLARPLTEAIGLPVQFAVFAVDATKIEDWIRSGPVHDRLIAALDDQRRHGFVPDLVLWQQGEADARAMTSSRRYRQQFSDLVTLLRSHGITAPIMVALSTRCRSTSDEPVRSALLSAAHAEPGVILGPDTDVLDGRFRHDGCHFSEAGLAAAADLWLSAIRNAPPDIRTPNAAPWNKS